MGFEMLDSIEMGIFIFHATLFDPYFCFCVQELLKKYTKWVIIDNTINHAHIVFFCFLELFELPFNRLQNEFTFFITMGFQNELQWRILLRNDDVGEGTNEIFYQIFRIRFLFFILFPSSIIFTIIIIIGIDDRIRNLHINRSTEEREQGIFNFRRFGDGSHREHIFNTIQFNNFLELKFFFFERIQNLQSIIVRLILFFNIELLGELFFHGRYGIQQSDDYIQQITFNIEFVIIYSMETHLELGSNGGGVLKNQCGGQNNVADNYAQSYGNAMGGMFPLPMYIMGANFGWGGNFPLNGLPQYPPFYGGGGMFGIGNGLVSPRQSRKRKLDIYSFDLNDKVGTGYSSVVYKGVNEETKQQVCIKIIDFVTLQNPLTERLMIENEIRCLKKVNSENILKLLDVLESKQFCYIVTQICEGGDLFKCLQMKKEFTQEEVIPILKGVANALGELRKKGIVHRDIKPSNVLLKNGVPKLSDFGFAIEEEKLSEKEKFNLGSPIYMSLEALKNNQYGYASDIFAFGIMAYQLLHRITPWESETELQLLSKMQKDPIKFKEGLSQDIKSLITGCLEHDISKRITIEQIQSLKLFQS